MGTLGPGALLGLMSFAKMGSSIFGKKPEQESRQAAPAPVGRVTPQKKVAKAGRLALIKTKRTGVFDEGSTAGRGKLFGN